MKIKFPRYLNQFNTYEYIKNTSIEHIESTIKLINNFDSENNKKDEYIFVHNCEINKGDMLEEYLKIAVKEKKKLLFHKCTFSEINIQCEHLECMLFFECKLNSVTLNYKESKKEFVQISRLQFINSELNHAININEFGGAILFVNTNNQTESHIVLNSCAEADVHIYDSTEKLVNLALSQSPHIKLLFCAINKSLLLIDDVSSEFEYFMFFSRVIDNYQARLFSRVTRKYYYYLKSINSEERFIYYKIFKDLEIMSSYQPEYSIKIIMRFITGHFVSPFRIFALSIMTILLFAMAYLFSGFEVINSGVVVCYHSFNITKMDLWKSIYLSVITFSTVGYGNIVPKGIGEVFASIEMILGVVYLGLFTGTVFNRYVD